MHQFCSEEKPLIICGSSMGGFIAIKLLEFFKISTLILLCPALYTEKAYTIPFDSGFTEVIRSPESWKQTDVFPLLGNFTGRNSITTWISDREFEQKKLHQKILDFI